jgi:UDP-N-acetylmuramate dehydrogenase
VFKQTGDIILGVTLRLTRGEGAGGRRLVEERLARRLATQPREPSAGCVFKNIAFDDVDVEALRSRGVDVDRFAQHRKIPAAYLIESAGCKALRVGNVQVSPRHANFLVNLGNGTAAQVIELLERVRVAVSDRFGIVLAEEVQRVGC